MPQIAEQPERLTAVVRIRIARNQIQTAMEPAFRELFTTLRAQGVVPEGPVFSHHFRMDPEVFDFEVGVPVGRAIEASERVEPGVLPACTVVRTKHIGGYEGLGAAWGEFGRWIEAEGHEVGEDFWEVYLAGPESSRDPAMWVTELNRPLKAGSPGL